MRDMVGVMHDRRRLLLRAGRSTGRNRARVVLAADGLGGSLLARAGATGAGGGGGAHRGGGDRRRRRRISTGRGWFTWRAAPAATPGWCGWRTAGWTWPPPSTPPGVRAAGGPGRAAARLVREAGWPPPDRLDELPWRGTPALTRRPHRVAAERVFVVGDAAGYVEPFTGEGMAWALASGVAVAPLAARAVERWRPELARQWADLHRRVVGRRQVVCRAAAAVLRRPWLHAAGGAPAGTAPRAGRPRDPRLNR